MPDLEQQLRAYGTLLDRATTELPEPSATPLPTRRVGAWLVAAVLLVALGVAVAIGASQRDSYPRVESGVATSISLPGEPDLRAGIDVERVEAAGGLLPPKIVSARGDVFVTSADPEVGIVLERRDATTREVSAKLALPFVEGVNDMLATDDAIWAWGLFSDAGPVSGFVKIDLATFTIAISKDIGVRAIFEADGMVWAVREDLEQLDPATGGVIDTIAIPGEASSVAFVDERIQVGLVGGRVAVIDPAREAKTELVNVGDDRGPMTAVIAVLPLASEGGNLAVLDNGRMYVIDGHRTVRDVGSLGVLPTTVVLRGAEVWVVSDDLVGVYSLRTDQRSFYLYDANDQRFVAATADDAAAVQRTCSAGIAFVGDTVWIGSPGPTRELDDPVLIIGRPRF